MTDLRTRLLSRLVIAPSGCVLWTGTRNPEGYGHIYANGSYRGVHRVMYEMFAEAISGGLTLDHLCRVRHCVNVAHLEPVTERENILRGTSPQAINSRKSHCDSGHLLDERNTYLYRGKRICRACNRDAVVRYKGRKRVASLPEAGQNGSLRFGEEIWVDHVSEDWLAVAFAAILRAQVREADDRTARQVPRRRTA
jgi:hypothetical protein